MLSNREAFGFVLLIFISLQAADAQDTQRQFWPELNVCIQQNDRLRFVFQNAYEVDSRNGTVANFTGWIEVALRPVFRRPLRQQGDVFKSRFLTFRAGYRYITPLSHNAGTPENRAIVEFTGRYPVPLKFVITDRSRLEFRFIRGQDFSMRYRNRFGIERDLKLGIVVTPYARTEFFYDTRYDAWARVRYTFGAQFPVGPHFAPEPYFGRQNNTQSSPRHTNILGLKFNLYF